MLDTPAALVKEGRPQAKGIAMSERAEAVIRLHAADNVVIALADLAKGTRPEGTGLDLPAPVPRGHKIAARPIAKGEKANRSISPPTR